MKTPVVTAVVLLFVVSFAHAQAPPVGYLGIYADESQTTWCASGTPPYTIDMWIYVVFGENGTGGYSFDLEVPANVEVAWIEYNRYDQPTMCKPPHCPNGIYGTLLPCLGPPRWTSTWLVHATLNVLDAEPSMVRIIANPDTGEIRLTDCDGAYETPRVWTDLYVNYDPASPECGTLPVRSVTWGMIKTLYGSGD